MTDVTWLTWRVDLVKSGYNSLIFFTKIILFCFSKIKINPDNTVKIQWTNQYLKSRPSTRWSLKTILQILVQEDFHSCVHWNFVPEKCDLFTELGLVLHWAELLFNILQFLFHQPYYTSAFIFFPLRWARFQL